MPAVSRQDRPRPDQQQDHRIADLARQLLTGSPYASLQRLQCDCQGGVLKISGRLPSFYLKQLAQSCVRSVDGVHAIDNQVEVVDLRS